MALDLSALASLSSSLDELTLRIGQQAAACDEKDEAGLALRELERQLEASARRLTSILRQARR